MNRLLSYWFIILLVSLYGCTSKTVDKDSQARNDSIKKYLDLAWNDSLDFEKRGKYNDKAYSLLDLSRNDTLTRYNLYCISYKFFIFNRITSLKFSAEELMKLSIHNNDSLNIARAQMNLGLYYMSISKNEKAVESFFKAKKIFKLLKRTDYVIQVLGNIAATQYYACDFLGSNKTLTDMIIISDKTGFKALKPSALMNIGDNLSSLRNEQEAINYYKKADKLITHKSANLYNAIAINYIDLKNYDSASKYLDLNLKDRKLSSRNPSIYSRSISLKAFLKLKLNQLDKLEGNFINADRYFNFYNSPNGRNHNQIFLSEFYVKIKDTLNGIKAARKALNLSRNYKNPSDILSCLRQLINIDKKNASANAMEFIRVNDSLQISERNFRDKYARIAFETDEITQEKDKAINQKWIIGTIAGVLIIIIALLLIINRQRSKQKEMRFQQSQQKANEEIYDLMLTQKSKEEQARQSEKKRIAIELHDGVMNRLASTRLNLNMLSYQKDEKTINNCLNHIEGIYKIEQEIRNIAHDLNTEIFNEANSFVSLINDFVATQNATTSSKYKLENDTTIDWNHISSGIKMNLYRIIQEASHNVNKYAQASNVIISVTLDENNICLSITDNGKGFDTNTNSEGIGLNNIKLRVESLNGKVVIKSNNKSTSINIKIPFII